MMDGNFFEYEALELQERAIYRRSVDAALRMGEHDVWTSMLNLLFFTIHD